MTKTEFRKACISSGFFYMFWRRLNLWFGIVACAAAFCMLYPGFQATISNCISVQVFNALIFLSAFSCVMCDFVEILLKDFMLKCMSSMCILLRDCGENRCVIVLRILCMFRLKVVEISMVTNVKLKIEIY